MALWKKKRTHGLESFISQPGKIGKFITKPLAFNRYDSEGALIFEKFFDYMGREFGLIVNGSGYLEKRGYVYLTKKLKIKKS